MSEAIGRPARLVVVIGAMRCGTTTLFQLLQQAPNICLTRIKEPDYFIAQKSLYRGPVWYASLFAEPSRLCVDISPNYAKNDIFPGVAEQIHSYAPNARIIYIVRDPVKRAVSEYHHQRAAGVALPPPGQLLDTPEGAHILSTSAYGKQLAEYRRVFPAEQILVVDMEEFIARPQETVGRMMGFGGETSALPPLTMSVENDRGSVERIPGFWLALRRTRLGDRIRDLVPARMQKPLKAFGAKLLGRKPPAEPPPEFDPATLAEIRRRLAPDIAEFRAMTGLAFANWPI